VDELLQKHRTFTLSVAVGGFVFLMAILLRGCAVYDRDLDVVRAKVQKQSQELSKSPVPDEKYLKEMDRVVAAADARVAELAAEVGRTEKGERLLEEEIVDVLRIAGEDTPEVRRAIREQALRLPSAAFSLLVEKARSAFAARAAQNEVEILPGAQDLGFETVQEAGFTRSLAGLAAACRIVDRAIALGVDRIENVAVSGSAGAIGGTENAPFINTVAVRFKFRGEPADLAELIKSVNDRDREGKGRRVVLDEIFTLGRPEGVRTAEAGIAEFSVKVFLVNLEAKEEAAQ
jgi:hypothetical protein